MKAYAHLWWNDDNECKKTEVLEQEPVPGPYFRPQMPHRLARDQTHASAVRSRQLTTVRYGKLTNYELYLDINTDKICKSHSM